MKKKFLTIIVCFCLALSVVGSVSVFAASIGEEDLNWSVGGTSGVQVTVAEDGFSRIRNLNASGDFAGYNHGAVLDGLEITVKNSTLAIESSEDYFGISFGLPNNYVGEDSSAVVLSMNSIWGQGRMTFYDSYSYANARMLIYTEKDESSTTVGNTDKTIVFDNPAAEFTVRFTADGDWYKIEIVSAGMDAFAYTNAGYDPSTKTMKGYVAASLFEDYLNENGEIYITAMGWKGKAPTTENMGVDIKIADDNSRAYSLLKEEAFAKIHAYASTVAAINDQNSFDAAMVLRAEAVDFVRENIYEADISGFEEEIADADSAIATNAIAEGFAKDAVQVKITAAKSMLNGLTDESAITEQALEEARLSVEIAQSTLENYADMLKTETYDDFEKEMDEIAYALGKANVAWWFIALENMIAALDPNSATIGTEISAIKEIRSTWEISDAKELYDALQPADKEFFDERLEKIDEDIKEAENISSDEIKESYLLVLEEALKADLLERENLDAAMAALENLKENISFTEADGELYQRYVNATATLADACADFISAQIALVSSALDEKIINYSEYAQIKNDFGDIYLGYIDQTNDRFAEVKAAYDACAEKLESSEWYYIAEQGIEEITKTESGLYFEIVGEFPNRFNYNKPLQIDEDGVEVEIELTRIAYYNGDLNEDGSSKGSNNLSINFLLAPNAYKSEAIGITIVIWLFETESGINVYDMKDNSLANAALATPIDGGTLKIKLSYGDYYDFVGDETYKAYQLSINNSSLVIRASTLTSAGIDIPEGSDLYFSLGYFTDNAEDTNELTVVSIDGLSFKEENTEPVNPGIDDDEKPSQGEQPNTGGCNSNFSSETFLMASVLLIFCIICLHLIKKKT